MREQRNAYISMHQITSHVHIKTVTETYF